MSSRWFEGLLYAESLILDGYTAVSSNGWLTFGKENGPTIRLGRYNSEFGKDLYFQGMLDYLENRNETRNTKD